MKKIIIIFLIISNLNLISCYYNKVEKEVFIIKKEKLDVKIVTQDSNVYYFDAGKYFVENDTIKGLCKKEITYNNYEKVQIPLNEIKEYRIENQDHIPQLLLPLGIFSVIVFLIIINRDSGDHMGGK